MLAWLCLTLLFSRFAVAAYACSMPPTGQPQAIGAPCDGMADPGGPADHAGGLDPLQPVLCHQHCQFGHGEQSANPTALQAAAAAPVLPLYTMPPLAADAAASNAWPVHRLRSSIRPPPVPLRTALCCLEP